VAAAAAAAAAAEAAPAGVRAAAAASAALALAAKRWVRPCNHTSPHDSSCPEDLETLLTGPPRRRVIENKHSTEIG